MNWVSDAVIMLIPVVGTVALFSFLAVATWADARRREREAYYRYEFRKQLVEAGKMDADDVRDLMQYEQEANLYRSRQGSLVGGFVLMGVGIGMYFGLQWIDEDGIHMVGLIPLFIGIALTVYSTLVASRGIPTPPSSFGPPGDR